MTAVPAARCVLRRPAVLRRSYAAFAALLLFASAGCDLSGFGGKNGLGSPPAEYVPPPPSLVIERTSFVVGRETTVRVGWGGVALDIISCPPEPSEAELEGGAPDPWSASCTKEPRSLGAALQIVSVDCGAIACAATTSERPDTPAFTLRSDVAASADVRIRARLEDSAGPREVEGSFAVVVGDVRSLWLHDDGRDSPIASTDAMLATQRARWCVKASLAEATVGDRGQDVEIGPDIRIEATPESATVLRVTSATGEPRCADVEALAVGAGKVRVSFAGATKDVDVRVASIDDVASAHVLRCDWADDAVTDRSMPTIWASRAGTTPLRYAVALTLTDGAHAWGGATQLALEDAPGASVEPLRPPGSSETGHGIAFFRIRGFAERMRGRLVGTIGAATISVAVEDTL